VGKLGRHGGWLTLLLWLLWCAPAAAQMSDRFSLDSAIGIDVFQGQNTVKEPNIVVDITAVVRLGEGWLVYLRPWFREPRLPHIEDPDRWDKEIYQAAVQYERSGPISARFEAGYIVSPIGLGMADVRPGVNPLIAPPLSYVQSMPVFDPAAPRVNAIAGTYPFGTQLTLSTHQWDARVAVLSSAPTRSYVLNGDANPRATPVLVVGGGVTPTIGLRLGAAYAGGAYVLGEELRVPQDDNRGFHMFNFEGEYAFGYTKISGEFTNTRLETAVTTETARAWFIQGMHTLAPRWFVAARQEGVSAPPVRSGTSAGVRQSFQMAEATVGYRLTTDFTLRSSLMSRKAYTRTAWDQQVGFALVWARRWR
jgi:hypothetical protein